MTPMRRRLMLALTLCCLPFGQRLAIADEPAPLMPADLLREADKAPAPIAGILRKLAVPSDRYDQQVLAAVNTLLKADDAKEGAWAAEKALRAGLRYSLSREAGDSERLANELVVVRRHLLKLLAAEADGAAALAWADVWLPLYSPDSPLAGDIRTLWVRQAENRWKADDSKQARAWLDRIDAAFWTSPQADPLRKEMRGRAEALLAESKDAPDAKAVALLSQAIAIWPRLPGLRDELEKRNKSYQVLYVAARELPEYLSPALAWADAERQIVELVFESLVQVRHDAKTGPHYRPVLAESLPAGAGIRRPFRLRRDVYWSDGEHFTSADIRHSAKLLGLPGLPIGVAWRETLEMPQLEDNPFLLDIFYRHGVLDAWAPLGFKVLPQQANGKPLSRADDIEFAKKPLGTGPYFVQGREAADGRVYVVLRANPHYIPRGGGQDGPVREIRFFAWQEDAELAKPLPHLVLGTLPGHAAALKKQGYTDVRHLPVPRVWYLGVNHRRPSLANIDLRRALAQAIDRSALVDRHFKADAKGATPVALNSLFPRGSWAACPPPRVPEKLYSPEDARASARKAAKTMPKVEWTLKYPQGDRRLDDAFAELAKQVAKVLAGADVQVVIRPVPLPPRQLQEAVRTRDFDLVYHHLDLPESPETLWPLFDPDAEALKAGGSNFLGYDDGPLQTLLRSAMHHRQFSAVRSFMQDIDAHLHATMPLIPLWQLPYSVAVHEKLRTPDLDALAVFGNVLEWKLIP